MRLFTAAGASAVCAVVSAHAAVSIYVPLRDVAARAPIAVEAVVDSVASGYDPETGSVATYVTLSVVRSHRGPGGVTRIVLRERGGRFGDLVHETDAVPVYRPGERVFAFVGFDADGAPRTAFDFFGKFTLEARGAGSADRAVRDLGGKGTIFGRPVDADLETFRLRELVAEVSRQRRRTPSRNRPDSGDSRIPGPTVEEGALAPPEFGRLVWDDDGPIRRPVRAGGTSDELSTDGFPGGALPDFTPLNPSLPVRWTQADSGEAVVVNVEPDRNPLADDALAVTQVRRAMAAWSDVAESRIDVVVGNGNHDFTGLNAQSPAKSYPPVNVVLFGDPYQDIADPSGCSGTLAIGGYWRSGVPWGSVNNVTFYPATRLYVIFNNAFECFLGDTENLAEIATHELGHGLGFGHSGIPDAAMRAYAYGGGRGPRLGDDDRDGAHCHYPHSFSMSVPNGGEEFRAGDSETLLWTASPETGAEAGTVSLEWSADGGFTWTPIIAGTPNDGSFAWTVPNAAGTQNRIRVIRPNRVSPTPAPYPTSCSSDASNANFRITAAPPLAGTVPEDPGSFLLVDRGTAGEVSLTWGASCSAEAADYVVYDGSLDTLRKLQWDHAPVTCSAGADLAHSFLPPPGARYFLVAPTAGGLEGTLGRTSWGVRPESASACGPRESATCP